MWDHLPCRIVFVRHPQCAHNITPQASLKKGIINRHSPLTEKGWVECAGVVKYIRGTFGTFDAVFSSTYLRTDPVAKRCSVREYTSHEALDERNMGVWHYMPKAHIAEQYPNETVPSDARQYYEYTPPLGENCPNVEERLSAWLKNGEIWSNSMHRVLFSGHGIAGLCLRKILTGASLADWRDWYKDRTARLKNASVTVYDKNASGYYTISLYNHAPWSAESH